MLSVTGPRGVSKTALSAGPGPAATSMPGRPSTCEIAGAKPRSVSARNVTPQGGIFDVGCGVRPQSISVGSAPPASSWPSSRTVSRHSSRPCGVSRDAAMAGPMSKPAARKAAAFTSIASLRATKCRSRGPAPGSIVSRPNQRARAGGGAAGSIARTSKKACGKRSLLTFNSRLCVPISACAPPGPGVTPSTASHHCTPCARVGAVTTRWSSVAFIVQVSRLRRPGAFKAPPFPAPRPRSRRRSRSPALPSPRAPGPRGRAPRPARPRNAAAQDHRQSATAPGPRSGCR